MASVKDIAWLAGFLEGEGSFYGPNARGGRMAITAVQVQREPLERIHKIFGGSLYGPVDSKQLNHKPKNRWAISGINAVATMMTIYPLMSPERKDRIKNALNSWRIAPGNSMNWIARGFCKNNHDLTGSNYVVAPSGHGRCRQCGIEGRRRYYSKNKDKWRAYSAASRARKGA